MTADEAPADPQWLRRVLDTAVAEGWCTRTNCTTCASEQLRMALGLLDKSSGRPEFSSMPPEMAKSLDGRSERYCPFR